MNYILCVSGKAGGRATLLVGAAIEAGCVAYDIRKAKRAKKDGRLSDRDFEDVVGKRLAVAVGDVSLSTIGKLREIDITSELFLSDFVAKITVHELAYKDHLTWLFCRSVGRSRRGGSGWCGGGRLPGQRAGHGGRCGGRFRRS